MKEQKKDMRRLEGLEYTNIKVFLYIGKRRKDKLDYVFQERNDGNWHR